MSFDAQIERLTVPADSTTSGEFISWDYHRGSVQMPQSLDSDRIYFESSNDGTNWHRTPAAATNTALAEIDVVPGQVVIIPREVFHCRRCRIQFNATETADRELTLSKAQGAAS